MSIFTIYNPTTKELGEEKEFKNYIDAGQYCRMNYPEGFVSKHEPFHFNKDFEAMLKDSTGIEDVKRNDRGQVVAIIADNVVINCGKITMGEFEFMRKAGIKTKSVSYYEFIKLHNALVK